MNPEITSYEAKTKLAELLRGVRAGNRYTITLRGQPVAELVPASTGKRAAAPAAVEEMREFMRSAPPVKSVYLKSLVGLAAPRRHFGAAQVWRLWPPHAVEI